MSKYWKVDVTEKSILFWPEAFYEKYFHDDLLEGEDNASKSFFEIKKKMDEEF
ncbi:hypothetical protein [Elizabethkingia meningoseptica]|uniref:hypothetical protein n=1 Tax=Elizabethkingia meningoseptica TaxID=238 RepID=UPI00158613A0|nr:hypothetical protein [Elizabethkingia meningoseptica]MDE5450423.1 hypothetical protein [Elizabethkingia meningoseptica]MDE5472192.1 hypothetical protein [Elizabethkingia meningoseptica]MDE5520109.1 hypothetical protein [Elizabethkingia meningoseptica]MDE5523501.1 hypothetical protein [Elizabethkingia meningoseptica]